MSPSSLSHGSLILIKLYLCSYICCACICMSHFETKACRQHCPSIHLLKRSSIKICATSLWLSIIMSLVPLASYSNSKICKECRELNRWPLILLVVHSLFTSDVLQMAHCIRQILPRCSNASPNEASNTTLACCLFSGRRSLTLSQLSCWSRHQWSLPSGYKGCPFPPTLHTEPAHHSTP